MNKDLEYDIHETNPPALIGNGATFWAYVKPETKEVITTWVILLEHQETKWSDIITSDDPYYSPQTPNLSGTFNVTVIAGGPRMKLKILSPKTGTNPNVGCNENCAAMIGIVSETDGTDAIYWTVWDAICN